MKKNSLTRFITVIILLAGLLISGLLLKHQHNILPSDLHKSGKNYLTATVFNGFCLNHPFFLKTMDEHSIKFRRLSILPEKISTFFNTSKDLLLTVETLPDKHSDNVLSCMVDGKFDRQLEELSTLANKFHQRLFIRWNPEMEVPSDVFPWQNQSPLLYIKAFNYFSTFIKLRAPRTLIVWSPAGYPGDTEYWPGEKHVDLISLTLKNESEANLLTKLSYGGSAAQELELKLHHYRFFNKPVLILCPENAFRNSWLENAKKNVLADSVFTKSSGPVTNSPNQPVKLIIGVFDPHKKFLNKSEIAAEHIFTDWGEIERGEFSVKFRMIAQRKHRAIITLEPWRDSSKKVDTNVLLSTLKGRYDLPIKTLVSIVSASKCTVYLRFAHEMEIPIHRYAWQSQNPVLYIRAYRYFMNFFKNKKNVFKVWGPAGDRGSVDYFPGNDLVDLMSFSIYGLPDKNITGYAEQESFENIFNRKNYRLRFINKPLFITEFGVKGPSWYQENWLIDAARIIKMHSELIGVCYFNLYDSPNAWGKIKAPDWSISEKTFQKFNRALD